MLIVAPVMGSDGGEYTRMGESLYREQRLVGNFEGPETLYAPLYPVLIAVTMTAVPDPESAAHVVSLVLGTALIVPVFLVARLLYGHRAGYIGATLVAVHPFLIAQHGSVFNETVYLTLLMAAIYWGLRCLQVSRRRDFALLGLFLGLSYLTRVEAFAYVPFFVVVLLTAGLLRKRVKGALLGSAIMVALFLAIASPYVAFLYRHTGTIRLEAKWDVNYTMARNRISGMSAVEATYGLGEDMKVKGPLLAPSDFATYTPYPDTLGDKLGTMVSMVPRNVWGLYDAAMATELGSPLLLFLVVLGLFRRPWSNRRLAHESVLLLMAVSIGAFLLTSSTGEVRYFLPMVPLLVLWAGKGVEEVGQWVREGELVSTRFASRSSAISAALQACAVLLVVGLSARAERNGVMQERGSLVAARDAGRWLAKVDPASKRIAVYRGAVVPYYSQGTAIELPCADPDTSLRYLASRKVDYVVLESRFADLLPNVRYWLDQGLPADRARLVYDETSASGDRIEIYRWQPDSAG